MKTKLLILTAVLGLLTSGARAADLKAYQLPNLPTLASNSVLVTTVDDVGGGSRHIRFGQLTQQLATVFGTGGTTYTNHPTNPAGVIAGASIGTNPPVNITGNAATATTASNVVSGVTNQWLIDATNAVNGALTTFTTILRTNATTADWQTALDTGGTIFVIPGTYVLTTNVSITNSFKLIGNGAIIQAAAGLTNFLFDSGTNTLPGPVEFENLQFDGERSINYRAAGYFAWNSGSPSPYFNPYWTNRSALRLSGDNPGSVSYCKFYGWPGQGLMIVNPLNLAAYTKPNIQIVYNSFYSNFIGCILAGHAATTVGYYNNPVGGWMTAEGEYTRVMGNTFTRNTIALDATPGNAQVFANRMTDNGCALLVASSVNAAHGTYSVNTMNHNDYGIVAESNLGGVYSGNVIIANNTANVIMNNCQWVKFDGNFVGSEWLIFTNGCIGSFRNNQFDGTWGTDTLTNFGTGMRVEGNYSDSVANGHDGSILSQLALGNGLGLTNLNIATAFTNGTTGTAGSAVVLSISPTMTNAMLLGRTTLTNIADSLGTNRITVTAGGGVSLNKTNNTAGLAIDKDGGAGMAGFAFTNSVLRAAGQSQIDLAQTYTGKISSGMIDGEKKNLWWSWAGGGFVEVMNELRLSASGGGDTSYHWLRYGSAGVTLATNLFVPGTITTTNGVQLIQTATVPTNSIPAGSASVTNFLNCNIGGIPISIATNYSAGGFMRWNYSTEAWVAYP